MGSISPTHLLLVLVVALIVIGPSRLPETGAALGKALRQFRDAANGLDPDATATTPAATPTSVVTPASTIVAASAPTAPAAAPSTTTNQAAPAGSAPPPALAPSDPDSTTPQA